MEKAARPIVGSLEGQVGPQGINRFIIDEWAVRIEVDLSSAPVTPISRLEIW